MQAPPRDARLRILIRSIEDGRGKPESPSDRNGALPGVTNYFIGNDTPKWRTNVAGYAKVKYEDVYPGIDLVYYDNGEGASSMTSSSHQGRIRIR